MKFLREVLVAWAVVAGYMIGIVLLLVPVWVPLGVIFWLVWG